MRTSASSSVVLALAAGLAAQGNPAHVEVWPAYYRNFDGNSSTFYPFSPTATANQHRLQLIYNELRGHAISNMRSLAFRRDGVTAVTTGIARTVDLEVLCGAGDAAAATTTFANNYIGTPTVVYTRKMTNLPDRSAAPTARPMPFDVILMFDNLFTHAGTNDFLYELKVYGNSLTGAGNDYYSDYATQNPAFVPSTSTTIGAGCMTNASMTLPMTLSSAYSSAGTRVDRASGNLIFQWSGLRAPTNSPVVAVLLGLTNPNLAIPGLCGDGRLYSSGQIVIPAGAASATGSFTPPVINVPWDNAYALLAVYTQAVAADPSQPGLQVAVSNGLEQILPPGLPPTFNIARLHHFSDANGATGLLVTGGLVVRTDH
jgi:hypothetical protein